MAQTMDLWPSGPPDGIRLHDRDEEFADKTGANQRLNRVYSYVNTPTLTVLRAPESRANGAAVVIFPGGGYRNVWIDKEGYELAQWLNSLGITGVVVKYRTRPMEMADDMRPKVMAMTLADAERAMRLTRQHAAEWGIDPGRIGAMGFSAGGHLAIRLAMDGDDGAVDAGDPVGQYSSRPNFIGLIYPSVPDPLTIRADFPPTFIANASDDPKTPARGSVRLYSALLDAGVPAELHIFREGDHGFGLGFRGGAVRNWLTLFEEWLGELKVMQNKP